MDPLFGKSNIYIRVSKFIRRFFKGVYRKIREVRLPRPHLGNVWLRLSYFEDRLARLDQERQEMFIENFYHSVRQVNYITLLIVMVVIATYISTFQFRMIGFWEGLAVEILLAFTLFYIVWFYRMGMEDLMDYLTRMEETPDYAFRPRFARDYSPRPSRTRRPSRRKSRKRSRRR